MKKQELIDFLKRYNHWRKGADIPMPKDVSVAIEAAIAVIQDSDEDVAEFILNDYELIK